MMESLRPTGRRNYPATCNPSGPGAPAIRKEGLPITITTRKAVLTTTATIRERVVGAPRRSSTSSPGRRDPLRVRRHRSADAVAVSDRTAARPATPPCHPRVHCARSHGRCSRWRPRCTRHGETRSGWTAGWHGRGLRMGGTGVVHPVRSGVRYGLVSPATPERTPCGVASSQVRGAGVLPVVNPDCMGDCA